MPAAADTRADIRLPAEDFREAVVDLAAIFHVSIGGTDPALCGRRAPALSGRLSAREAYARLFAGSACMAVPVGDGLFRIVPVPPRPAASPPPAPPAVSEVVVTGYRRALKIGQVPGAVSVASPARLARYPDDLASALRRIPGFTETNLGPGRDKIMLRGQSDGVFTGRTQTGVALYLDDTPISYDAPDPDLLLTDMERVEVLEGPQGALYGAGSISGVVRLVTRPADKNRYVQGIAVSGALTRHGGPSARAEAMVNLPLLPGKAGLRLVAYDDQAAGFVDDTAIGKRDINHTNRVGARLAVTADPAPGWQASVLVAGQSIDTANSQYVGGDIGPFTRAVPVAEAHDNDFGDTAFGLTGTVGGLALKISLNHLHHHWDSVYDATPIAAAAGLPAGTAIRYSDRSQVELDTHEVSLASPPDGRVRWLAGLYGASSLETDTPDLVAAAGGTTVFAERRFDSVHSRALFAELDYDLTSRLVLSAGLRLAADRHTTTSRRQSLTGAGAVDAATTSGHVSHSLSAVYRFGNRLTAYVQAAEGYRNGGVNTTWLGSQAAGPESYGGDELNTYEAGLRWTGDGRREAQLAFSHTLWRNIQSDQLQASGLPVTVNVGDAVVSNLEGHVRWPVTGGVAVESALQWTFPRLTRANPAFAMTDDAGLPYVSGIGGTFAVDWDGHAGPLPARAGAELTYVSRSHLNFGQLQAVTMNGVARLDLSAAIRFRAGELGLRLDNALDTQGNSFAYGNPFSLASVRQSTPLRPRTLWLSWKTGY